MLSNGDVMNHKRKNVRGHIRRKYFGAYRSEWLKDFYAEEAKDKKMFLRIVQASQAGVREPLEAEGL